MIVLNFSHPLSTDAQAQLSERYGEFETRQIRVQLDMTAPMTPQVIALVETVGLTPDQWQTEQYLVVLPAVTVAAGILVSEVAGRSGTLPSVVSLVSGEDRVFRISEVIDLQQIRNEARKSR